MQRNNENFFMRGAQAFLWSSLMATAAQAGAPVWTFTPLTPTTVALPPGTTGSVEYLVTNHSSRPKNLVIQSTSGITQTSACNLAAKGAPGSTCTLTLEINGSNIPEGGIQSGPRLCLNSNPNQCYQPERANVLHIVKLPTLTIGEPFQGGVVACLDGGLNNFVASTADNSTGIVWGGLGTQIGASAQSTTDGAANTAAIVATLGNNGGTPYAAQLCNDFEVDSQGNTPCELGNTCYNDWFLPAGNSFTPGPTSQIKCLFNNRVAIGGFTTTAGNASLYNSSTEDNANFAFGLRFDAGTVISFNKNLINPRVRCIRTLTP